MLHGVILCGGLSRRMGSPKALLPWGDGNLLRHAVVRIVAAGLEPLCAGPADWAGQIGCQPVSDQPAGAGPLGGIAAALAFGDCFVLAVDMPLLTAEEISHLVKAGLDHRLAAIPVAAGRPQPLAAFWPQDLLPAIRKYLDEGGRSVLGFLDGSPHLRMAEDELRRIGVAPSHFQGANSPEEYLFLGASAHGGEGP